IAEIVRRRSWGGVLPLGRHASIRGSRSIHAPSVSIAPPRIGRSKTPVITTRFKLEQALVGHLPWGMPYWAASDGEVTHVTASERSAAPLERRREESARTTEPIAECTGSP